MSVKASANRWVVPYYKPNPRATIRLFCFPYAGGGASVFVRTLAGLPSFIDVCPVQPPGRENRVSEPHLTSVAEVAEKAAEGLASHLDMPFALFGHSLGALVAYELAQRLRQTGAPEPRHLLVSAHRAPHIPLPHEPTWTLPDDQFKERLQELNGTPTEVLENEELRQLMFPLVRADFRLDETYRHPAGHEPLDCPIKVFGGRGDVETPESELSAWSAATRGGFKLVLLDGDHFFIHSQAPALTIAIAQELVKYA